MNGLRVLIGEDEGLTTFRLRSTLTHLGCAVVGTAKDGEEVIEAAGRLLPEAILMDIEMPKRDGIAATQTIMECCPTAILIISAYSQQNVRERAMAAGASGYLMKPVTDDQIEAALRAALEWFRAAKQGE